MPGTDDASATRRGPAADPRTPTRASENALARRAGLGDELAFRELFARLFPATLRFATHLLDGDESMAEDTVQEAWIRAWRGLPDFRGTSRVRTWLFTIVQHEAYARRRRARPSVVDHLLLEPSLLHDQRPSVVARATDPERVVLVGELHATLVLALTELPWNQRASWVLRELEGLSYLEIAAVLDTTPTVVRGQLHRARRALAVRMDQWR